MLFNGSCWLSHGNELCIPDHLVNTSGLFIPSYLFIWRFLCSMNDFSWWSRFPLLKPAKFYGPEALAKSMKLFFWFLLVYKARCLEIRSLMKGCFWFLSGFILLRWDGNWKFKIDFWCEFYTSPVWKSSFVFCWRIIHN